MATTKHTPGPWQVRSHGKEEGGYVPIYTEDNLWIAEAMGRGGMKHSTVGPNDNNEIAFNAALIAAAPDLLAILEKIERLNRDGFDIQSSVFQEVKTIIAKATNPEPSK